MLRRTWTRWGRRRVGPVGGWRWAQSDADADVMLLLALWGAALLPATGDDGGLSVALKYTLELPLPQHQEDRIVDRHGAPGCTCSSLVRSCVALRCMWCISRKGTLTCCPYLSPYSHLPHTCQTGRFVGSRRPLVREPDSPCRLRGSSEAGTTSPPQPEQPRTTPGFSSTVWTTAPASGPPSLVDLGKIPYSTPTALASCIALSFSLRPSIAIPEENWDSLGSAGAVRSLGPRLPDPPSTAARPRLAGRRPAEQDRSMRAPSLSGERRSSAAACSPMRLSHLHDQQLSSHRPPPPPPRVTSNCVTDNVSP